MLWPLANAAWLIDGSDALSQSLMYAVIRSESKFYPKAISPNGSLGALSDNAQSLQYTGPELESAADDQN